MSLDQKAYRVRTSSALVRRALTLAPAPDSYPLAIGYWSLRRKRFTTETQRTQSIQGTVLLSEHETPRQRFPGLIEDLRQISLSFSVRSVSLW
jgi:hypothetical protein